MYPFWEPVIAPMLQTFDVQRVVEVGALRGETTTRMLDDLGPAAELHVIDPLPSFDPAEHERRFGGRYLFHRDLSLNVLADLPAFDVALIDGDHNWYSVLNELRLLADGARRESKPLPLCLLHDVCWPYGRRDLYYDPSNIPAEHRQPYDRRGMRPGKASLLAGGGMNRELANALQEGGPQNGVMTGLDDFIAEHDRPLRRVVLPFYYGLAIVADHDLLDANPPLRANLDELESRDGTRRLLELSERIRLDEAVFGHNLERFRRGKLDRAVDRLLSRVAADLGLDEGHRAAIDSGLTPLLEETAPAGDILHDGSQQVLDYLVAFLEAHEVENRRIVPRGEHLSSAADAHRGAVAATTDAEVVAVARSTTTPDGRPIIESLSDA